MKVNSNLGLVQDRPGRLRQPLEGQGRKGGHQEHRTGKNIFFQIFFGSFSGKYYIWNEIYLLTFFFSGFQAQDGRRGQHPHQENIKGDLKKYFPKSVCLNYFELFSGPRPREEHHRGERRLQRHPQAAGGDPGGGQAVQGDKRIHETNSNITQMHGKIDPE